MVLLQLSSMGKSRYRQRGMSMIVSLIMLLLLTVIGVSAMQGTQMQERMAGNLRDSQLAFDAAEAALRSGERTLWPLPPAVIGPVLGNPATWDGNGGTVVALQGPLNAQPRYHIGRQGEFCSEGSGFASGAAPSCWDMFAVTSRAVGGSDLAVSIVQSHVATISP